ncbi:UDP-phosphate glucose phosphotransferase [Brevundimonas sp. GW460-12-10-14-LB2]|uniref:exopolysaccharide biosynthesis polyprenyl glycosylphosphotransferase n=1 Tax=Brevundimonas TaxID=41275 RepID=UPI0007BCCFE7|nr:MULTISPECIES: exopolysaccharide biosynthesis polyprenyl glycosylphosphotransferase [Brevundimonas]ANC52962.1 UDP-phosphate glucose phosphotransferase [Brevundimonas sp. GW460-12-10-14-LB2]MEA3473366.1 exopolysaccharide biosynthesis polyprenyl glycosylphosphotransferase [Pseudomonadota bacterium]NSX31782.1 exopolysaccharide biosynthesis polyprenyl glycosylphosphotransferase [Brevundimonas vesicularis]
MLDRPASLAADTPLKSRPSRGPFRPEIWLNARERSSVRLSAHYFRLIDVLMVCGLAFSAVLAIQPTGLASITVGDAAPVVVGAVLVLELMRALQLYRFGRDTPWPLHMAGVVGVGVVSAGVALVLGWLLDRPALDVIAPWALTTTAALALLHGLWLVVIARWRRLGVLSPNIVIVGATRNARRLIEQALERRDMNVLGVFDDRLARSPESVAGVPVLGDAKALLTHRLTPYVDRIVLAIDPEAGQRVRDLTQTLNALPNPLTVLVDSELGRDGLLNRLANAPLASLDGPADPDRRAFNKRMQDLVIGAAALVVAAPIMSLVALAVKLDSRGPVFFRQRRHGFNHETIVVWKFRSMRHAAADATASRQVCADDDRVTRVGRFIRATSLDELPQIFNVLSGEMSLVGPRPHAIGMKTGETESALLVAEYAHRHRIKPGMTGWAAIKGSRGPVDTEAQVRERVQLDIEYIERQSFWLDLWVIAVTIPVLLGDRAAVR